MNANLNLVSDAVLLTQTKAAVEQERLSTVSVLRHLREIERRRLHLERGFSSLHEYCVRALGYSDGAAHRRLSAMRLIASTPSVDVLVESGKLSLSTAAQLQDFFKAERRESKPYSAERRMELVEQSLGRSRREVERDLATLSPGNSSLQRNSERQRVISQTETALTLVLSAAQLAKLARFRQCTSHRNATAKMAALIEHAVDLALERVDPQRRKRGASSGKLVAPEKLATPENLASPEKLATPENHASPEKLATPENHASPEKLATPEKVGAPEARTAKPSTTRYVSASTRRLLHARAQGQCMYRDQLTSQKMRGPIIA